MKRYHLFLFLILDSLCFTFFFFKAVEGILLVNEGVIPLFKSIPWVFICIIIIPISCLIYPYRFTPLKKTTDKVEINHRKITEVLRGLKPPSTNNSFTGFSESRWRDALGESIILIFLIALPTLLTFIPVSKGGMLFAWLPLEWHKLPMNTALIIKVLPIFSLTIGFLFLFLVWLYAVIKARRFTAFILFLILFFILLLIFKLSTGSGRIVLYLAVFGLPIVISIWAAVTGRERYFARLLFFGLILCLTPVFYSGLLPRVDIEKEHRHLKGIKLIYPPDGKRSEFPLSYMRDFQVDQKRGYLFTSYGPTSGVVRIDLLKGEAEVIDINGLIRQLWTDDALEDLFALDWIHADILAFSKDPFVLSERRDIFGKGLLAPSSFSIANDRIYVAGSDYAVLVEFDRISLERMRCLNFRSLGLTRFKSGAFAVVSDTIQEKLFLELGFIDTSNADHLLKIDQKRFEVEAAAVVPSGGPMLLPISEKGTVLVSSFYYPRLYEYRMEDLSLMRVLKGPLNTRNMAYDAGREVLYLTGYMEGDLHVVRHEDGQLLKKVRIGKKVNSMCYVPETDLLYVGGSEGIYEIKIKEFLGE